MIEISGSVITKAVCSFSSVARRRSMTFLGALGFRFDFNFGRHSEQTLSFSGIACAVDAGWPLLFAEVSLFARARVSAAHGQASTTERRLWNLPVALTTV